MKLPSGNIVEAGISLQGLDFKQRLLRLMEENFSGYLVLQIEGFDGLEEGLFLFKNGEIQGALYEYLKFDMTIVGDVALSHCINAAGASVGVVDIVGLGAYQVDMAIAFDQKIELTQKVDKRNLNSVVIKGFTGDLAKSTLQAAIKRGESNKNDLFKKFGLENVSS